ncbi:hypothetical protein Sango_1053500 [Sesamum angolense]|uniref:Retrotransposon gag domain-containing protein n=1 Tax=Sesamum angolense TaxID=2727404 RepID=A0AAE2BZ52_9LAMI|nr:hypothetical protein Sango_1053500 [Sesamum angolense]
METYFQVARIPEAKKVSITSIYLTSDAKLWWRTHLSDDVSVNREKIETWDILKKELKHQFLPCNTSRLARESLRKLKHAGTMRYYVKEFSSLMLDVWDMSRGQTVQFPVGTADLGSDGVEMSGCQGSAVCDCCCGIG